MWVASLLAVGCRGPRDAPDAGRAAEGAPYESRAREASAPAAVAAPDGATDARDTRVTSSTDAWLSGPDCSCAGEGDGLAEGQLVPVMTGARFLAEERLAEVSVVPLREADLPLLVGADVRRQDLLRAMTHEATSDAERLEAELATVHDPPGTERARWLESVRRRADGARRRAAEAKSARPSALRPYLVRGMALGSTGAPTGAWLCAGPTLEVYWHGMGHGPRPASRAPVVAFLLHPPVRACAQVGMTD